LVSGLPPSPVRALPASILSRRCTSMHFGENQLSPSSFGISPLPTALLTALQRGTVRASTPHYGRFTLAMGSSLGFGSAPCHYTPCSDSLSLRYRGGTTSPSATRSNSPVHSSIGTPSGPPESLAGAARFPSDRLSADGFRFYFTPRTGVLFTVPSRYYPLSVVVAF
jgi:hypothetical protein